MTKEQHIDLIIDFLSGGDAPSDVQGKYHPEIIAKHLETIYNSIIYDISAQQIIHGDYSQLDAYTKTFTGVAVTLDEDRNEYYSSLPVSVIQLPKNRGIRKISLNQDQALSFMHRSNNSIDIMQELEVSSVTNIPRYYLENDKIFYDNISDDIVENGVLMKLVIPFSEFDDEDELTIPAGKDNVLFEVIAARLRQKPAEDVYNDTNTNQIG